MVTEVTENETKKLLAELDEAIEIITIAKAQKRMMFIKGVVRYVKSMAPASVKEVLAEVKK